MAILKYSDPNTDVFGKRFSDIMDEFFNDAVATRNRSFAPSVDISETDKKYNISIILPLY